ncbi:hypothetical protein FRACYDRAFT_258344 [Fragilariopsis cylindrus CCMP1102]|uniref:Uncharacterized protein n=1 Tax=Fragilariopsis cylindrus CCMP1102 TaxID=635003 RepID=A0A1E7EIP5_9STRA|nr:hypothetical protein FRACYDRAFT_258344 [Fragilariopsis cylindrus CCMP1102]|eukprot:OEU05764.1 hypothetical protein FRACYDRAFT_258344 [Fragilariopsis cylindrus CCMP1102]
MWSEWCHLFWIAQSSSVAITEDFPVYLLNATTTPTLRENQTLTMTATNSEYWKNLHCDMKHLILHLGGLYCDRDILLEQFAMAIAYSNQSSIGVLSNAVLMMSCIYWVSDLDQHPLLVRPYNILLLQENVHSFQEKMVCTYVFRQIRTSFSGLETAYTKLKHSIEDSEKLTISLSTYRKALKRLQFYIALSRWYIINIYQNQNTSHILQIRNDTIIVVGEFKEIVEYMRSWEEAMKTWAAELFINIYNIDYIVTQWHHIEAEKEKDAVEFDIMEDIKKIRSMGTCVVGFADLATQKLRCLTQELKKNFETLSRQNTLTNTTLTSHLGLIAGFDVRLEKYLKGKQWTTCNKDDSTAVLVDCQDSGNKHKIRLITLEEKVASKRKLGRRVPAQGCAYFDKKGQSADRRFSTTRGMQ